jgi:hypothetical protein
MSTSVWTWSLSGPLRCHSARRRLQSADKRTEDDSHRAGSSHTRSSGVPGPWSRSAESDRLLACEALKDRNHSIKTKLKNTINIILQKCVFGVLCVTTLCCAPRLEMLLESAAVHCCRFEIQMTSCIMLLANPHILHHFRPAHTIRSCFSLALSF